MSSLGVPFTLVSRCWVFEEGRGIRVSMDLLFVVRSTLLSVSHYSYTASKISNELERIKQETVVA
jgi:hypothetical protein